MVKRMKLRASVRRDRHDVTSISELVRGERTYLPGLWRVSLSDGRSCKFIEWRDALDYAVRATEPWDPFA